MSKIDNLFTREEFKENSLEEVSRLYDELQRDEKFFQNLCEWIHDYCNYLKFENSFDPKKNCKYERGSVIQVKFGLRPGNELGGPHYAVVLDLKNSRSFGTVTVIPLGSMKEKYRHNVPSGVVSLGSEIYDSLYKKFYSTSPGTQDREKVRKKLNNLKQFSVAKVNQITTISKMRIINPKNSSDALYGVKISKSTMHRIEEEIKQRFFQT